MTENRTRARLKAGETVVGCFVRYPSASLVEMMTFHGWDFFVFDGEHGTIEPVDCEQMTRAVQPRGATPIARVPTNEPSTILRFLDTGAQGVHVPLVNSPAEAEAAVRAIKYHPRGERGLGGVRAAEYGQGIPLAEYVRAANEQTLTVLHIETETAIDNLRDIVAVDDVDVVFVGPTDLSQSLGIPGERDHPRLRDAIGRAVEAVVGTDVALGTLVSNADDALQWKNWGARYIATGLEAVVATSSRSFLAAVR
jgi:4-hydroxy-2-oxoheptanedioate aldolase